MLINDVSTPSAFPSSHDLSSMLPRQQMPKKMILWLWLQIKAKCGGWPWARRLAAKSTRGWEFPMHSRQLARWDSDTRGRSRSGRAFTMPPNHQTHVFKLLIQSSETSLAPLCGIPTQNSPKIVSTSTLWFLVHVLKMRLWCFGFSAVASTPARQRSTSMTTGPWRPKKTSSSSPCSTE